MRWLQASLDWLCFWRRAPRAPTIISADVVASGFGKWAGGYQRLSYRVTLCNRHGESAPTAPITVEITAAQKAGCDVVHLIVANARGGKPPAYANVYRSDNGDTALEQHGLVMRVALQTSAPRGRSTLVDHNLYLPFTEKAYMGEWSEWEPPRRTRES